jgi:hypothetical protein
LTRCGCLSALPSFPVTNEPEDPNRPNNLWSPVPGDHGARGTFTNRAHAKSYELEASLNRRWYRRRDRRHHRGRRLLPSFATAKDSSR